MEWYWWALIIVAVVAIAALKLKVIGMILARRRPRELEEMEDE
jgi:hypothetical protein